MLRDYPGWSTPLAMYVETPCKVVALRDVFQRVGGWARYQDLLRERRRPRGGGGWLTKATLAEIATKTLSETNKSLVRRLESARSGHENAHEGFRRFQEERIHLFGDVASLSRALADAHASCRRTQSLEKEQYLL